MESRYHSHGESMTLCEPVVSRMRKSPRKMIGRPDSNSKSSDTVIVSSADIVLHMRQWSNKYSLEGLDPHLVHITIEPTSLRQVSILESKKRPVRSQCRSAAVTSASSARRAQTLVERKLRSERYERRIGRHPRTHRTEDNDVENNKMLLLKLKALCRG